MIYEKRKKDCPLILLLGIIIFSQNVWAFSPLATGYWSAVRDIAQMAIFVFLTIGIIRKGSVNLKLLCVYMIFMSHMLLTMFWVCDFTGRYWLLDCTIAYLFVEQYNEYSVAEKFEKIMFVICAVYTLLYAIALCNLDVLTSPVATFLDEIKLIWRHPEVYKYYVTGATALRSYAIFREPGVYQMFIVIAMLIEFLVRKRFRWTHVMLYAIALLATYSTTGYMCLLLIGVMFALKHIKRNRLTVLCAIVGSGVAIPLLPRILSSIISKFTATGANSHSWLCRKASFVTNIYFWKENPIIGVGIPYVQNNFEKISRKMFGLSAGTYAIKDDTNTVLLFFAAFGTMLGVLFVLGTYGWCKKVAQNNLLTFILFIILLFLYSGEAVNSTCYPYVLFFVGISSFFRKEKIDYNKNYSVIRASIQDDAR